MKLFRWMPVVLAFAASGGAARAASLDFELFDPAPVPQHGVLTESPRPVSDTFTVGGYWQVQGSPVVEYRNGQRVAPIVYYRWQQRLLFSWVPWRYLQVSADLPVTLLSDTRVEGQMQAARAYFNDLTLRGKGLAWETTDAWGNHWSLGGGASLSLPTGNEGLFGGSSARFLQPTVRALAEFERGPWFARANLGYAEKDDTYVKSYGLVVKDRVQYRLGGGLHEPRTGASYVLELNGHAQVGDVLAPGQGQALELYAGSQVGVGPVQLIPGASLGLTQAFGVPAWRLFFGAFYGFSLPAPSAEAEPVPPATDAPLMLLVVDAAGEPVAGAAVRVERRRPPAEATATTTDVASSSSAAGPDVEVGVLVQRPAAAAPTAGATAPAEAAPDIMSPRFEYDDADDAVTTASAPVSDAFAGDTTADGRWGAVLPLGEWELLVAKAGYVDARESLSLSSPTPVSRTVVLEIYVPPPPGRYHFTVRDAGSGQTVTAATATFRADAVSAPAPVSAGILEVVWTDDAKWQRVRFDAPGYRSAAFEFGIPPVVGTTQWVYVELVPEVGEKRVVVTRSEIVILDRINFQSGSDRLAKESLPVVDGIAAVLVERPDVQKVVIAGHTDNVGRPAANLTLSTKRAEAVRRRLIEKGVAPERLDAVGFGDRRPIADNATAAGKAENRRVEFRIERGGEAAEGEGAPVPDPVATTP